MGVLIAIDFDKTLTTGAGDPWWEDPLDEEPDERMVELVNGLYERGHYIHVWTARREEVREETTYFLDEWDVKYHALVMEKHSPALFIDDKALNAERALDASVGEIESMVYGDDG
jgi:hypothetical protein